MADLEVWSSSQVGQELDADETEATWCLRSRGAAVAQSSKDLQEHGVRCEEGAGKKVQSSVQMVQCVQPGSRAACMQGACRCSIVARVHVDAGRSNVGVWSSSEGMCGAEARQYIKGYVAVQKLVSAARVASRISVLWVLWSSHAKV